MKIYTFFDLIKEGNKNILKNKSTSIGTIFIMFISLTLLAGSLVFKANIQNSVNILDSQIEIGITLNKDISIEQIQGIEAALKQIQHVKEVRFVSKEEGLAEFQKTFAGDDENTQNAFAYMQNNPLPNKFILKADSSKNVDYIVQTIDGNRGTYGADEVINHKQIIEKVVRFTGSVQTVLIIISIVMTLVVIVMIFNNIKLNIKNQIREIFAMSYVGASKHYITMPYVAEGIILGLISAILSIGFTYVGYYILITSNTNLSGVFTFLPVESIDKICIQVAGLGIVIGYFASLLSTKSVFKKINLYERKSKLTAK